MPLDWFERSLLLLQTRSVASRQSRASSLRRAPETGALRRTASEDPEPKDSWDIFEPRVATPKSAPADSAAPEQKGGGCDLKELKHMTGGQRTHAVTDTALKESTSLFFYDEQPGWGIALALRLCATLHFITAPE